jgi:putative ABC transport system substrate-binding protein
VKPSTPRRTILAGLGAAILAPQLAFAQAGRKYSVVVVFAGEEEDDEPAARPFFDEMKRLGWNEGVNIGYERLYGKGTREYMEGLVKSAVGLTPDLIYATTANIALALTKETDSVPVVFTSVTDPVAVGLVASLKKPGRNATGAFQAPGNVVQRRFELVREALPTTKRIGLLVDRRTADYGRHRVQHEEAAKKAGLDVVVAEFTNFEAVAKHLANFRRDKIQVTAFTPSVTLLGRRREVVETATRNRIALVAHRAEWAEVGALMTYGADVAEVLKRSAKIADRILKGARPAETPVAEAKKFELVFNQRTAALLGVELQRPAVRRASRVIE